jgi:hypothetical protein
VVKEAVKPGHHDGSGTGAAGVSDLIDVKAIADRAVTAPAIMLIVIFAVAVAGAPLDPPPRRLVDETGFAPRNDADNRQAIEAFPSAAPTCEERPRRKVGGFDVRIEISIKRPLDIAVEIAHPARFFPPAGLKLSHFASKRLVRSNRAHDFRGVAQDNFYPGRIRSE